MEKKHISDGRTIAIKFKISKAFWISNYWKLLKMPIEKDPVIFTTLAYAVLNSIARGETNESYRFKFRRNSISNFLNFQRKTDFNVKSPIISISKKHCHKKWKLHFTCTKQSFKALTWKGNTLLPLIFMIGVHPPSPHPKSPMWQKTEIGFESKCRITSPLFFDLLNKESS